MINTMMKSSGGLMCYKKLKNYNRIITIAAYFILFSLVLGLIRSMSFIDPKISFDGIKNENKMITSTFVGEYKIDFYSLYHIKRVQEYIIVGDLPNNIDDPTEYVKNYFNEQLIKNGWKQSTIADLGKHDCNYLLPEMDMYSKDGFETFAYRRKNFEPTFDYYLGDLICMNISIDEEGKILNFILVTAKPSLINKILETISV